MQDNHFAKDEAVSALIKSMRFGNFEEAGYWLVVLVENGTNEKYLAKRLAVFASEDCFEQNLIVLANSVYQMYLVNEGNGNMLWQVLYRCCKAKKFWEVLEGQEYELSINEATRRYLEHGIETVPKWAIDKHTKRYYELVSQGKESETDRRFSGEDFGRLYMINMFRKYGEISPDIVDTEILEYVENEVLKVSRD
jgi:replication-associated recombination protein RarA